MTAGHHSRQPAQDEPPASDGGGDHSGAACPPQESFTALLARHRLPLLGYIVSLVPSWADAEDIFQQSSVVMWRKFLDFKPGTSFLAWGCQIARFHALNHLRKQARDRHVFSPELLETLAREGVSDARRLEQERGALQGCIEKLDPASRELLGRCYGPGATIKEVALRQGRTPNSVYKSVNRIRETLLRCVRRTLAQEKP